MRYPPQPIAIEYTNRGKRVLKVFTDMYRARAFYVAKDKAGKQPKVRKALRDVLR